MVFQLKSVFFELLKYIKNSKWLNFEKIALDSYAQGCSLQTPSNRFEIGQLSTEKKQKASN